MSTAFVSQLRSRRTPIEIAPTGEGTLNLRVEASDLWETVRVVARPDTPVAEVKRRVVETLFSNHHHPVDFVLKLRGWEILEANGSLADAGVFDGAILLLAIRRRRAVR